MFATRRRLPEVAIVEAPRDALEKRTRFEFARAALEARVLINTADLTAEERKKSSTTVFGACQRSDNCFQTAVGLMSWSINASNRSLHRMPRICSITA